MVYLRNKTPNLLVSALASRRLSTARRSITPSSSPRLARRPSRRNEFHTSSMELECSSLPLNEKRHLIFKIHDINVDDSAEAHSYYAFSACTTMTSPRTVTHHHARDGRLLPQEIGPLRHAGVVPQGQHACCLDGLPHDRTLPRMLHNMAITNGLMANLALAEMDLIQFAQLILQNSTPRCTPSVRTLSFASSKQWPPSRGSP